MKISKKKTWRAEKAMEHEGNGDTNCSWCTWNGPKGLGDQGKNRDHLDNSIVETS